VGECGFKGTCELRPTECVEVYEPVCSCEGLTYSNSCYAAFDGINIAYSGTCESTCIPTAEKEKGELCRDGIDNDCNGLIDNEDLSCKKPNN
jgi:hypothetical protein